MGDHIPVGICDGLNWVTTPMFSIRQFKFQPEWHPAAGPVASMPASDNHELTSRSAPALLT